MRNRALLNLAVGVVILGAAVALGAAGALAASNAFGDDDARQAVLDDAADELGVEPEELSDALREALENRIDEAVDDGWLTEEQGEELKDRIESSDMPFVLPGFEPPFELPKSDLFDRGPFGFSRFGGVLDLDAAAAYLGIPRSELRERLGDGDSLVDIAEDEDKSVDGLVDALVDAAEERIDRAAERGRLSEEEADELKSDLEERVRDRVDDELRFRPFGFDFEFDLEPRERGQSS